MDELTAAEAGAGAVLFVVLFVCALFVALMLVAAFHQVREPLQRFICRVFDHKWKEDTRADPVIPAFAVCRRCGKWERKVLRERLR